MAVARAVDKSQLDEKRALWMGTLSVCPSILISLHARLSQCAFDNLPHDRGIIDDESFDLIHLEILAFMEIVVVLAIYVGRECLTQLSEKFQFVPGRGDR